MKAPLSPGPSPVGGEGRQASNSAVMLEIA